jgi:transcriptional regulator with XRE-family HTH domain
MAYTSPNSKEGRMDTCDKALGARIRELRSGREMSQERLAELSHMSIKHLGKIERGTVNVSFSYLTRIAAALGVTVNDILETEHMQGQGELLAELSALLPQLPYKDLQVVYRLTKILVTR